MESTFRLEPTTGTLSFPTALRFPRRRIFVRFLTCLIWSWLLLEPVRGMEWPIQERTALALASREEGAKVLGTRDLFIRQMSPFDRASRLQSDQPVGERQLLDFASAQSLAWTPDETRMMEQMAAGISNRTSRLRLPLPRRILMVKTTGLEEAHAAYTRGEAIVLPAAKLKMPPAAFERLLLHEIFHVLSRANPKLRDELYRVIGFELGAGVKLPEAYERRRMTNPDAPVSEHWITVEQEGKSYRALPILLAKEEPYSKRRGWEFFQYLQFRLLAIELSGGVWRPMMTEGGPLLLDPERVSGFYEKVGRNTRYTIHPEEIMADNFVLWVQGASNPASPNVLAGIDKVLNRSSPPVPRRR